MFDNRTKINFHYIILIILIIAIMVIIINIVIIIIYCHFNDIIKVHFSTAIFAFHVPKLLFLSIILLALHIFYLYKICRFKLVTPVHSMKFRVPFIMPWHYKQLACYQQNTNIGEEKNVCERAELASLDNFCIFTFQKLFLSIFCWYFRYFVGMKGLVCRYTLKAKIVHLQACHFFVLISLGLFFLCDFEC